jgi:hypothetical protein
MDFAVGMRNHVSEKVGQDVALWSAGFGAPVGAMAYAMRVDGLAGLQAMTASLATDEEYQAKLAKGRDLMAGPAEDSMAQPIHGELGDPPPVGSFAMITTAVIGNGAYAEAIAWGVDMAQHAERVSGMPTMFLMNSFGTFGQVTWIGIGADAAAVDAAGQQLNSDADYMAKLGAAGNLFVPASGHRSLLTRVA